MSKRSRAEVWEGPSGDHDSFVRDAGCVVPECPRALKQMMVGTHAHHVKSRGAGGGYKDLVGLCLWHHDEIHKSGKRTFAERHGVDLASEAARLIQEHYEEDTE